MKYNTKEIYFGVPTYQVSDGDFWRTKPEVFLKKEDKYLRVSSKNNAEVEKFSRETTKYVTVSNLCPLVSLMSDKKEIPEQISGMLVNLYLTKYKIQLNQKVEKRNIGESKRTK